MWSQAADGTNNEASRQATSSTLSSPLQCPCMASPPVDVSSQVTAECNGESTPAPKVTPFQATNSRETAPARTSSAKESVLSGIYSSRPATLSRSDSTHRLATRPCGVPVALPRLAVARRCAVDANVVLARRMTRPVVLSLPRRWKRLSKP